MTTNPETAGVEPVASDLFWHVRSHEEIRTASLPVLNDGMIYGWRTTGGAVYAGEGYPVPIRRFALDNTACAELMIKRAHPPAAREDGEAEIARLRGLLVDPGTPPWEDMRAVLVAELDKAGLSERAAILAEAGATDIPSWMALNLMATITLATTRPAPEQAPEPKCFECGDSGEVFGHADDCDNDSCALNGDIDSCLGKVEPCGCFPAPEQAPPYTTATVEGESAIGVTQAPDLANCAVGEEVIAEIEALIAYTHERATKERLQKLLAALAAMPTPAAIRAETAAWSYDMAVAPEEVELLVYRHDKPSPWSYGYRAVALKQDDLWFGEDGDEITTPAAWTRIADIPHPLGAAEHLTGGGE